MARGQGRLVGCRGDGVTVGGHGRLAHRPQALS